MRRFVSALMFTAGLVSSGQTNDTKANLEKLTESLAALTDSTLTATSHRDRIVGNMMALSEENHPPSSATVVMLAHGLVRALSGRPVPRPQASVIATDILAVLHSAGVGTFKFQKALSRFENSLRTIGVAATEAKNLSSHLAAMGKEVRGPEGMPVERWRFRQMR
jgi:hypothetical protein